MPWLTRLRTVRRFHTGFEEIRDAGGPVTLVHLGPSRRFPTIAVVTSPQGAHDVLGGSDGAFDKENLIHIENRVWAGTNLFNITHEPWLEQRRALQPLFTKQHVAVYADCMAESAGTLAESWAAAGSIDLDLETRALTLRVLGQSLFGLDLGDRAESLGQPLTRTVQFVTRRAIQPVRAPVWMPTPARHRFRMAKASVDGVIDDAIAAAHDPDSHAELIRRFFDIIDPATGAPFTDAAIRHELGAFLFAGHDTTATTLTYALWVLGRDHVIQNRVAEEADAATDRPLQVADLAALPYTVRVIHESLRRCPPAAGVARMAMRDVVVDGFRVPAGTNVAVGIYALHHDPRLWDDPQRFDPDRFTRERSAGRDRWQYLPFGGGPRTCIGDHFAMLEATLALASIVRALRVDSVTDDFPLATPFTMVAAGPVPARVRARTTAA